MKAFHNLIITCKGVINLHLNNCNLQDNACNWLFLKAFIQTKRLHKLDLSHNHISDAGCEWISEGFKNRVPLESLSLSSNFISGSGAKKIFTSLVDNRTLKNIKLNDNKLNDDFAVWLGRYIKVLREEYNSFNLVTIGVH
jgi:Ran GTPase-activating protein (RanGAP) involved in mRNA processing and transport